MGERAPRRVPEHGSRTGLDPCRRAAASVAGLPGAIGNRAMARLASGSARASGGSRALALRSALRPAAPRRALARDLKKRHYVWKGKFDLDLTTESHAGAKNGMSGTVKFTPDGTGGDSTKIRLYQALRDYDLDTGADYVWTGGDAGRNSFRTTADAKRGVEEGWGIDINPAAAAKRTKKTDKNVSPYYDEVEAGVLRWDMGRPYLIRHEADGLCCHNDRGTGGCGVYDDRPTPCKRYSCAGDERIWSDFDAMELNHEWIAENLGNQGPRLLHAMLAARGDG